MRAPTPSRRLFTIAEYFALEAASPFRHEFHDGVVYRLEGGEAIRLNGPDGPDVSAFAGARPNHSLIVGNVASSLNLQLRGRPCTVHPNDLRVAVENGRWVYPDLVVVCGRLELRDDHPETVLNPTLVVEVLSPSTEKHDQGPKRQQYRRIPSLQEYVIVAQDQPHLQRYSKHAGGLWLLEERTDLNEQVEIPSIGCVLALAEVYDKVEFAQPDAANADLPLE